MEECDVTLPDLVALELPCEVAEGLGPAGQEDDSARFPVETMDGVNPEPRDKSDLVAEARVSLDPGPEDGTETHPPRLLNTEARRFFHRKPSLARGEDRNGEGVHRHCVTHTCPKWKSQHRDTEEEFLFGESKIHGTGRGSRQTKSLLPIQSRYPLLKQSKPESPHP